MLSVRPLRSTGVTQDMMDQAPVYTAVAILKRVYIDKPEGCGRRLQDRV
jgi:hypothetical protein